MSAITFFFSLPLKFSFFESTAHFSFLRNVGEFCGSGLQSSFFFSVGVIRGAASVSSSVKRDARCSEANCTLAALRGNDHRGKTVSFRSLQQCNNIYRITKQRYCLVITYIYVQYISKSFSFSFLSLLFSYFVSVYKFFANFFLLDVFSYSLLYFTSFASVDRKKKQCEQKNNTP